MIQPTLLLGASFAALSAGVYFYVGHVLNRRRPASSEAGLAWHLFVIWWYGLAASNLSSAVLNLLGAFGVANLPLFTTFTYMNLLAVCVGLFGLMFYLLYLFIGNRRLLVPLIVFYVAYYFFLVYYIQARSPISVTVERWRATLEYQNEVQGPLFLIAILLLVVPQIIGSLAYFTLYFKVKTATQKYRILLVSWSIIIWFLSSLLASVSGLSQQDWWQIVSRLIGLGASLTILMAYQPPSWIKHRFGVTAIAEG